MAFNKRAFFAQGNSIVIAAAVVAPAGVQALVSNDQLDRGTQIRIHNAGPALAFVAFGPDAAAAQTAAVVPPSSAIAIPPGAIEVWTVTKNSFWSAITSSGVASIYMTPGEGL